MIPALQMTELESLEKGESHLARHTVRSWLLTTDQKRVSLLYLFSILAFFAIAAVAAATTRLNLLTPRGDLVAAVASSLPS
jgi:cytochrome c oxidase subunit 1